MCGFRVECPRLWVKCAVRAASHGRVVVIFKKNCTEYASCGVWSPHTHTHTRAHARTRTRARCKGGHDRIRHGATVTPSSIGVAIDTDHDVSRLLRQSLRCHLGTPMGVGSGRWPRRVDSPIDCKRRRGPGRAPHAATTRGTVEERRRGCARTHGRALTQFIYIGVFV